MIQSTENRSIIVAGGGEEEERCSEKIGLVMVELADTKSIGKHLSVIGAKEGKL